MTIAGIFIRADEMTLMCRGRHEDPDSWSAVGIRPGKEMLA